MIPRIRATSLTLAAVCGAALLLAVPADAAAQRRGHRGGGRVVVVSRPLYFGYGFYDPFYWGYPGWGHPGWFAPYGPFRAIGSARLQVTPRHAEVYVDGYLAGTVDDFDGVFQRLEVPPGEHELVIYLEGYRTFSQKLLFRPGANIDIKQPLAPLAPGESSGPRPQASAPPAPMSGPPDPGGLPPPDEMRAGDFGRLAIRVQPDGATIVVDGEEWSAPDDDSRVVIDLADGPHEVEVRKDGLTTYRRTVQVRAGRTVSLNVSLSR